MEFVKNKKAYFDYEILDTFDAGIMLRGYEAKAIRQKKVNIKSGYVSIRDGEAWLENVQIDPYQPHNQPDDNRKRKRKLLLNRREIDKITPQCDSPGITIVPLKIFLHNHRIKVHIGICRGKKKHDKRETIKRRQMDRDLRQQFKTR